MIALEKFCRAPGGLPENIRLAGLIVALLGVRLALYGVATGSVVGLAHEICRWDCYWYTYTARNGYDVSAFTSAAEFGKANWAFFPVFPMLLRVVALVFPISYPAAGLLIANISLGMFVFVAVKYLALLRPDVNGVALVVFLLAFPGGFYLSLQYSESIYAALTVSMLYLLRRDRLFGASVLSAVLTATRVTGILLLPVLVLKYLAPVYRNWMMGERALARRALLAAVLPILLAPAGLFLFMAYLYGHAGDALAFMHVQAGWGRGHEFPLFVLGENLFVFDFNMFSSHVSQTPLIAEWSALAGLAMSFYLWRQARYMETWLLLMSVLLPLSTGLASMQRFVLANPVFMIFLFDLMERTRLRRWFCAIMAICVVAQLCLIHFWTNDYAILV